jgi:hypothetical protein
LLSTSDSTHISHASALGSTHGRDMLSRNEIVCMCIIAVVC